MPMVTWPDLLDGCSDGPARAPAGEVGVQLRGRRRGRCSPSSRRSSPGRTSGTSRPARPARPIVTSGSASRKAPIRAASPSIAVRSAFVRRRHGRDLDRQSALLHLVRPGRDHRAADDHDLADPAGRARHQRPAGQRQERLGLLLERQRVRVEGREQAEVGRRVEVVERLDVLAPDEHLGPLGEDLDDAVAERRDRLAQRRAALDAPPAGELALRAAGERGELALDDGADRVLAGLGHVAAEPRSRVDERDVPAVVGPEAQEAAARGGLQERAPARGDAVGERRVAELRRQRLAERGAGHRLCR